MGEHLVRLYADPGSSITFTGGQDTAIGSVTFQVTMSGHLVNVP
jgi:hypothetical protein